MFQLENNAKTKEKREKPHINAVEIEKKTGKQREKMPKYS